MSIRAIVSIIILMTFLGFGGKASALQPGDEAPRITATDQNGQPLDFGKIYDSGITLVYFYPKADTPGCTAQACSLRDSIQDLSPDKIRILGVSRDTPEAQKKFQEKYKLPFPLIADKEGKVAAAFGVPGTMGLPISSRQSFLVKDGKIVWVSLKAQTSTHAAEVKAALESLK